MTDPTFDRFELALDRMIRNYADGGVRAVDRRAIAESLVAGTSRRRRLAWPWALPHLAPVLLLVVLGLILAAMLAVFVGARLLENGIALGSNGDIAYAIDPTPNSQPRSADTRIHLVSPDGTDDRDMVQGSALQMSADGTAMGYFSGWGLGSSDYYVAKADGSNPRQVPGFQMMGAALSPNGTQVVWPRTDATGVTGELSLVDVADGRERVLVAAPAEYPLVSYSTPVWSPDGRWVAYSVNRSPQVGVAPLGVGIDIVEVATGEVSHVSGRPGTGDGGIAWSPDSQSIAFAAWPSGTASPATVNSEPATQPTPTPLGGEPGSGDTSDFVEPNSDLYSVRIDGTDERQIAISPAAEYWPLWSPDGRAIAFLQRSAESTRVATVAVTGGATVAAASIGPEVDSMAWSPDATQLLLAAITTRQTGQLGQPEYDSVLVTVDATFAGSPTTILTANGVITGVAWQPAP